MPHQESGAFQHSILYFFVYEQIGRWRQAKMCNVSEGITDSEISCRLLCIGICICSNEYAQFTMQRQKEDLNGAVGQSISSWGCPPPKRYHCVRKFRQCICIRNSRNPKSYCQRQLQDQIFGCRIVNYSIWQLYTTVVPETCSIEMY